MKSLKLADLNMRLVREAGRDYVELYVRIPASPPPVRDRELKARAESLRRRAKILRRKSRKKARS